MESEIYYIDKLIKTSTKNFEQLPETNWNNFNSKFGAKISPELGLMSKIGSLSVKKIGLTVVSLSIVTTGIFTYQINTQNTVVTPIYKKRFTKKVKLSTHKTFNFKKTNTVIEANKRDKSKDVIVRIKVPIHKEIIVRKEIKITDSVK